MSTEPEQYLINANVHAPNSRLPVLVYRCALPHPPAEDTATTFLEGNEWEKKGTFGTVKVKHFHPNTHECYGVFQGSSDLILGEGSADKSGGVVVSVNAGDVVVVPAGVAHASISATIDYLYIGVYPKGSPHWRNELGKKPVDHAALRQEISEIRIPSHDPVRGPYGPLVDIWKQAMAR